MAITVFLGLFWWGNAKISGPSAGEVSYKIHESLARDSRCPMQMRTSWAFYDRGRRASGGSSAAEVSGKLGAPVAI